jgi:hypothetical protein
MVRWSPYWRIPVIRQAPVGAIETLCVVMPIITGRTAHNDDYRFTPAPFVLFVWPGRAARTIACGGIADVARKLTGIGLPPGARIPRKPAARQPPDQADTPPCGWTGSAVPSRASGLAGSLRVHVRMFHAYSTEYSVFIYRSAFQSCRSATPARRGKLHQITRELRQTLATWSRRRTVTDRT